MEEEKLKVGEREFQNEEVTLPSVAKRAPKRKNKQSYQQIIFAYWGLLFHCDTFSGLLCSPLALCSHPS